MRKIYLIFLCFVVFFISFTNRSLCSIDDGLVAHYKFDGDAQDSSGFSNHGEVFGATLAAGRKGIQNTAYFFNGIDNYIRVNDSLSLRLENQFTITCWFYNYDNITNRPFVIKRFHETGFSLRSEYWPRMNIYKDSFSVVEAQDVVLGQDWYQLTGSYDGQTMRLFLNGQLVATKYYPDTLLSNNEPLYIGVYVSGETNELEHHLYGAIDELRIYNRCLSDQEVLDIYENDTNTDPIAEAGPNLSILSEDQNTAVVAGKASDADGNILAFRWTEGATEILGWQYVGPNGEAELHLNALPAFSIGQHILTLEVDDGKIISKDDMILTISNSAPHPAPAGGGAYEILAPVILSGQIADFDGDLLNYQWLNGALLIQNGQIQAVYGGDPVSLPALTTSFNTVGLKVITLKVSDGVNNPVSKIININVIDSSAPTLAPIPNKTILWPPNHKMVDVSIQANAADNSGNPVILNAVVFSNEPIEGLGDGDTAPDWTQPVINQQTGVISLQLRAERSGSGTGRVYTISITATDQSGNSSTADVKIVVPHDNRKK